MTIDPLGRQGIGVNQPPGSGIEYPLVAPSEDITDLLADFYLAYQDQTGLYEEPFSIFYLYGLGDQVSSPPAEAPTPTHDQDVVIRDANGLTVFDSTLATSFESQAWGTRLQIYEWQTSTAVCRIVQHTAWQLEQTQRDYDIHIAPDSARLDSRTIEHMAKHVTKLIVGDQTIELDDVDILAGYNTTLDAVPLEATDGGVAGHEITIGTQAGTGLGRYPGCTDVERLVRTINKIGPDAKGNFHFDVGECYRLSRELSVVNIDPRELDVTPYTLQLFNDCLPCCQCKDYVNTYKALTLLWEALKSLAHRAELVRDLHNANILRWTNQKECRENRAIRMNALAACPGLINIGVMFTNMTDECMDETELRLAMSLTGAGGGSAAVSSGTVVCGQTSRLPKPEPYAIMGSWPLFRARQDAVQPGGSMALKFQMNFGGAESGDTLNIQATVHSPVTAEPRSTLIKSFPLIGYNADGDCGCS